jgi:hypothetical protein
MSKTRFAVAARLLAAGPAQLLCFCTHRFATTAGLVRNGSLGRPLREHLVFIHAGSRQGGHALRVKRAAPAADAKHVAVLVQLAEALGAKVRSE